MRYIVKGNPNLIVRSKAKKKKRMDLSKILLIAGTVLFVFGFAPFLPEAFKIVLYIAAYLMIGYEVIWRAITNIPKGRFFDENTLMSIATIGAVAIGQYPEAAAVMIFYRFGESLERAAVGKTRTAIRSLMKLKPVYVNLKSNDGIRKVRPEQVPAGSKIIIKPGERVPIDAVLSEGSTSFDTSAITGESMPRPADEGDEILSGFLNQESAVTAVTARSYQESTVAKILELVENATSRKSKVESFISRFSKYYTPAVVGAALLLAVLPPLIGGSFDFNVWIPRALIFLVVSCPCALVLSIPLGYSVGIGAAARRGILVKGSNYLEALTGVSAVAFDKTGTLTNGKFAVSSTSPLNGFDSDRLLHYAAHAEYFSIHPIARSILEAYPSVLSVESINNHTAVPGMGVKAFVGGEEVFAGSFTFLSENGIDVSAFAGDPIGTIIHIAVNGIYAGFITVSDTLKEDSADAIAQLKSNGIRTFMLTGDNKKTALDVANSIGIDEVRYELLPQQKAEALEEIMSRYKSVVFAGDGINDAPVLKIADIGIAMGRSGADAAVESSDVTLLGDQPTKIWEAVKISRITKSIIVQNMIFIFAIKGVVLLLSALGFANMWEAVFADVGTAVLAVLNSLRILSRSGRI